MRAHIFFRLTGSENQLHCKFVSFVYFVFIYKVFNLCEKNAKEKHNQTPSTFSKALRVCTIRKIIKKNVFFPLRILIITFRQHRLMEVKMPCIYYKNALCNTSSLKIKNHSNTFVKFMACRKMWFFDLNSMRLRSSAHKQPWRLNRFYVSTLKTHSNCIYQQVLMSLTLHDSCGNLCWFQWICIIGFMLWICVNCFAYYMFIFGVFNVQSS